MADCLDDYLQINTKTTSTQASEPNDSRVHLLGFFQRWAEMKERNLSALSHTDKILVFKVTIFTSHEKNNPFSACILGSKWNRMIIPPSYENEVKRVVVVVGGGGGG